jgi:hypothetical protein
VLGGIALEEEKEETLLEDDDRLEIFVEVGLFEVLVARAEDMEVADALFGKY